jgi:UDP-glucose 4-epimerase
VILLVGGDGFLGRHLTDLLGARGYEVTAVTRTAHATVTYPGSRRLVVASALESDEVFQEIIGQATSIVYLASASVPSTYFEEPWRDVSANVTPAVKFFARCARTNPNTKVVLVSSGGTIYGGSHETAATEEMAARPTSSYGLGKLMIEEALSFFGRAHGLSYRILRVSNPVGKWQSSKVQGVVPAILRSIQTSSPFKIFGDGKQVRDFVDADDVAEAMLASIEDCNYPGRVWNVGSGVGRSVLAVLEAVESIVGRRAVLEHCPPRKSDVRSIVLDCGRIERELGWSPKGDLETAIAKTVSAWARR